MKVFWEGSGIYGIMNLENKVIYVGRTINFLTRYTSHLRDLVAGIHSNDLLQSEYHIKPECFCYEILERLNNMENSRQIERYYIEKYKNEGWKVCNVGNPMLEWNSFIDRDYIHYKDVQKDEHYHLIYSGIVSSFESDVSEIIKNRDRIWNFEKLYSLCSVKEKFKEVGRLALVEILEKNRFVIIESKNHISAIEESPYIEVDEFDENDYLVLKKEIFEGLYVGEAKRIKKTKEVVLKSSSSEGMVNGVAEGVVLNIEEALTILASINHSTSKNILERYLKGDRIKDFGFITKGLERLASIIIESGKGRKKTFQLIGVFEEIKERKDGRIKNGYIPKKLDIIFEEEILYKISNTQIDTPLTYLGWAEKLKVLDMYHIKEEKVLSQYKSKLDEIHLNTKGYSKGMADQIIKYFIKSLEDRASESINLAFSNLKKKGKIDIVEEFIGVRENGSTFTLSNEVYSNIKKDEHLLMNEYCVCEKEFIKQTALPTKRDSLFYQVRNDINELRKEKYDILYYFIGVKPIILKNQNLEVVGESVFYERYLQLARSRQKRYDKSGEKSIFKAFHLVHTMALLDVIGIEEADE